MNPKLSFYLPKDYTVSLNGQPLELPTSLEVELLPYPSKPVDPPEPPPTDLIPITPQTVDQLEKSAEGKSYLLTPGTYRPILLKDKKNLGIYGQPGVLFTGQETTYYGSAVVLEKCEKVHLENLEATGGKAGIAIYRSSFCGATKCNLHNNIYWGFFTSFANDCYCIDNETHHNDKEHGIYFSNDSQRPVITGNHSHHNLMKSGIQCNGDKYAGGEGVIRGAIISNNNIHDNLIGMNFDGLVDSQITDNYIEEGIRCFRIDGAESTSRNLFKKNHIKIVNTKNHGVILRNTSVDNRFEENTIELPKIDSWYYPLSVERGTNCTYYSMGNTFIGPSSKPIGGGTWGKNAEDLTPGDTSTFIKV